MRKLVTLLSSIVALAACATNVAVSDKEIAAGTEQTGATNCRAGTLSITAARELTKAFEIIQAEVVPNSANYYAAIEILERLLSNKPNLCPYDKATTLELIGSYYAQLIPPDYVRSRRAFERALALDALPDSRHTQIKFFLA